MDFCAYEHKGKGDNDQCWDDIMADSKCRYRTMPGLREWDFQFLQHIFEDDVPVGTSVYVDLVYVPSADACSDKERVGMGKVLPS